MKIQIVVGDITTEHVDAIVNAANDGLWGGGGVDGAIHRAAGEKELQAACAEIRRERGQPACPTGTAVLTPGFQLPAKHIIHTAGPIWHGGNQNEAELLRSCYTSCLQLAEEHGLKSIAFPAISTGVYGYPATAACKIALDAVFAHPAASLEEVRLVLFSEGYAEIYRKEISAYQK